MQFTAPAQPYNQYTEYYWNFEPNANNIQPNPVRTFGSGGTKTVTLTVKNQYGCRATVTKSVFVKTVSMAGSLTTNPTIVFQGGILSINYINNPFGSFTLPTKFYWYNSNNTTTLLATTTTGNFIVNQTGSYFAIIEDANTCQVFNTKAVTANFMPTPPAPIIIGLRSICVGGNITLKTIDGSNGSNRWTLDGVVQPLWDGLNEVTITDATANQYQFSVAVQVTTNGVTCLGTPATC